MVASTVLTASLKVLGDATRLRILALLEREELSVGELSRSLGMSQSRVSNHLRVLREAHLLDERRSGNSTFLRLTGCDGGPRDAGGNGSGGRNGTSVAVELWATLRERVAELPEHAADLGRLAAVVEERQRSSAEFFDRVAKDWDKIGVDFSTGQARQRAAASLLPPGLVLADLGCGTGYMARSLLGLCQRLICVDRSAAMLRQARERLEGAELPGAPTQLEFRQGELDQLPLEGGEVDGLVAGMVLHHVARLDRPLAEMRRVLRPGGTAVLVDLAPHGEEWMREAQGDRLLGLDPADVTAALEAAGFVRAVLETVHDHYQPTVPQELAGSDRRERARLPLFLVRAYAPL
jgi:ArsR family transcriptional regulator